MRILSLTVVIILALTSCKKEWFDDSHCQGEKECGGICTDGQFEDINSIPAEFVRHDVREVILDPTCNCIVAGLVKYTKDGITAAMVDYGYGRCDAVATKTICANGDCDSEEASCCLFDQVCQAAN